MRISEGLIVITLVLIVSLVSCATSSDLDAALKSREGARYYFSQQDYAKAEQLCREAMDALKKIKKSVVSVTKDWSIEQHIDYCENLIAAIPTEESQLSEIVVPVKIVKNSILVPATINQKQDVILMLDTGASHTLISPDLAQDLSISIGDDEPRYPSMIVGGDTIEVPFVTIAEIKIGGAVVKNLKIGVFTVFPDRPVVGGLLGTDFLGFYKVSIDYQREMLTLVPRNRARDEKPL